MTVKLLLALISITGPVVAAPQTAEKVRQALEAEPFSVGELTQYLKNPTPEIRGMIRAEFQLTSDTTLEGRKKKQEIANILCRINADDGTASAYLAKLAEEAVSTSAPMALALDENRRMIKGKVNPAFEAWAVANNLNVSKALTLELEVHPHDVLLLSYREDSRYTEIFRRGLGSDNLMVAAACAMALARLGDEASIKWIRTAAERTATLPDANEAWAFALTRFKGQGAQEQIRRQFAGTSILPMYENLVSHKPPNAGSKQ